MHIIPSIRILAVPGLAAGLLLAAIPPDAPQDGPPALPAPEAIFEGHFATGEICALCHASSPHAQAMRDRRGRPVAPHDLWRGSMMASSARDPLWRAVVSAEVAADPGRRAEIEKTCMRCHAPMASAQHELHGGAAPVTALLHAASGRGQIARDGVSCTACHQIGAQGLGEEASFSGGYVVGHDEEAFGPHEGVNPMPMMRHTGFTATHGPHILRAGHCATCHTLIVDHPGAAHGFPEQTPYQEWQNSVYDTERAQSHPDAATCQDCHLPKTDRDGHPIETAIAHNPGGGDFGFAPARRPFGRHLMLGGNTLVPALLRDNAKELQPAAPVEAFDATIAAVREQLRSATARLELVDVERAGERIEVDLRVHNLAGHKLPSGIPVRRVWLRLIARDAAARVLFSSGACDERGQIVGLDGAPLASERASGPLQLHHQLIESPAQVQVYEALLGDDAGEPVWGLLAARRYLKDNRLLPRGWSLDHPEAARTAPHGTGGDVDFTGGMDRVRYRFDAPAARGPFTVECALLYQPLSTRFAAELFTRDTPEVRALARMLAPVGLPPEVLAETTLRIQ